MSSKKAKVLRTDHNNSVIHLKHDDYVSTARKA